MRIRERHETHADAMEPSTNFFEVSITSKERDEEFTAL
jgi:hypothetical protein